VQLGQEHSEAVVVLLVGGERWRRCCGDGFTAAALLCSAAVQGGERRTGKEKQASEWRGRQQARRSVIHCDQPWRVGVAPVHCFHMARAS